MTYMWGLHTSVRLTCMCEVNLHVSEGDMHAHEVTCMCIRGHTCAWVDIHVCEVDLRACEGDTMCVGSTYMCMN